jgi:hypothetical protein
MSVSRYQEKTLSISIRMVFSGMLHRVAFVRADVSEELSVSFIRVTRNSEQGTTLAVTSIQLALYLVH